MDTTKNRSTIVRIINLGLLSGMMSACGVATHAGDGIVISGSPEGLRAFYDGQNALITNGKASADTSDTPAYSLRREQVRASVLRYMPTNSVRKTSAQEGS